MPRLATLAFIVGLPLLGIAMAEILKAHESYEYQSATRSSAWLGEVCSHPSPELQEVCVTRSHLNVLEVGSGLTGLFGIAVLWGISLSGVAALRHRSVYLHWAKAGLRSVGSGAVILTALQAAVVIAAIGHAGRALFGDYSVGLVVVLAVVAACWIIAMTRSFGSLIRPPGMTVIGKRLDRKQGSKLYERVGELAHELGAEVPEQIVVGFEANFFTTDATVTCVDGSYAGRTLYCSLPVIRILSLRELDALIGHVLRHPEIQRARVDESKRSFVLFPALPILDHFDEAFAAADRNHAHEQELSADRDAARVAGPLDVASAFVKAHTMSDVMNRVRQAAPPNISKSAAELALAKGDTQPVPAEEAAISLIEDIEKLEESLSARYDVPLRKTTEKQEALLASRSAVVLAVALAAGSAMSNEPDRVHPRSKRLLGIPIETLDAKWTLASLISEKNLPAGSRKDLAEDRDTAYRFQADGDFNGDGRKDRAVVGVYRTHDGEEGQFLLIVTKKRAGSWTATYLSKNTGFAGPSLLYPEPKRLNWIPCTSCDVGARVSWKRDRYRTEWVRTDR